MILGILQFDLLIHDAQSLKDKRRVVLSVKDRLHREHMVAVAEVAHQDMLNVARLGLAFVGSDGKHVGQTLDRIIAKLRTLRDAELGDVSRQVLHGQQLAADDPTDDDEAHGAGQSLNRHGRSFPHAGRDRFDSLAAEMFARAQTDQVEGTGS